ncbi:polysaccharide deacetylase family protein [Gordonia sp. NPDC003424]
MERRQFLTALAAGTAVALTGGVVGRTTPTAAGSTLSSDLPLPKLPLPDLPWPPNVVNPPRPPELGPLVPHRYPIPTTPITALPGTGRYLALTIDDGDNSDVVGAYVKFAQDTGARFTFFVTGVYQSWRDHRKALLPLVESGQIQLGNHTWTHPALTRLSSTDIAGQLNRNRTFLKNTFGVDGTPFYRPPYGYRNAAVDRVAADLGYTASTLWYGTLGDERVVSEKYVMQCARTYFRAQAVVIGHANHPAVTHVYPQLAELIKERNLTMVTLNDYFRT